MSTKTAIKPDAYINPATLGKISTLYINEKS